MEIKSSRKTTYETVYNKAIEVFQYDKDKALKWYLSEVPEFGMSPYEMCKAGKARQMIKMLNNLLTIRPHRPKV